MAVNAATARERVAIAAPKGSPLPPLPPLTAIVTPTVAGGGNRPRGRPRSCAIRDGVLAFGGGTLLSRPTGMHVASRTTASNRPQPMTNDSQST